MIVRTKKIINGRKKSISLLCILVLLVGCNNFSIRHTEIVRSKHCQTQSSTSIHNIFIFIHGTIIPYPAPSSVFSSIKKTLQSGRRDKISWYDRFIYELRFKSIYKFQPIQEVGLHKITYAPITEQSPYFYSFVTASIFQKVLSYIDSSNFSNSSFYTFGWDGKLSNQSRVCNAKKLYVSLFDEVQKLKAKYKKVNITILAHSHGGNVALNLARAYNELKSDLEIDCLILIGTPIQSETEHLITSPLFKKIYNFYSENDALQTIDVFSTEDSKSKRRFKEITPLKNLVQIGLVLGKKHPAHNELWLFGAQSNWLYRNKVSTYPIPIFIFTPVIVNFIEKNFTAPCDLEVNIDKDNENFKIQFKRRHQNGFEKHVTMPRKLFLI